MVYESYHLEYRQSTNHLITHPFCGTFEGSKTFNKQPLRRCKKNWIITIKTDRTAMQTTFSILSLPPLHGQSFLCPWGEKYLPCVTLEISS